MNRIEFQRGLESLGARSIFRWRSEPDRPTGDGRDSRLDLARCLGAMAVIYLHCSDHYTWLGGGIAKVLAYLIYATSLFCVPLFFMISGMLLIGRKFDPFVPTMKRRLLTVLKPFAFGALFYLVWQIAYQKTFPKSAFDYFQSLLGGSPFFHLWFLPALFGMYLLLPLFQGFSTGMGKSIAGTMAILFLISGVQTYINPFSLSLGPFDGAGNYLPYFLAGYCLSKVVEIDRKISMIASIVAPVATACLIALASAKAGQREGFVFEEFASPLVVVQSLAMFSLILKTRPSRFVSKMATSFAPQTLGVYILHFAVLSMLMDFAYAKLHATDLEVMLLVPLVTFFATDACVRLLHYIPGMKGYV